MRPARKQWLRNYAKWVAWGHPGQCLVTAGASTSLPGVCTCVYGGYTVVAHGYTLILLIISCCYLFTFFFFFFFWWRGG